MKKSKLAQKLNRLRATECWRSEDGFSWSRPLQALSRSPLELAARPGYTL